MHALQINFKLYGLEKINFLSSDSGFCLDIYTLLNREVCKFVISGVKFIS